MVLLCPTAGPHSQAHGSWQGDEGACSVSGRHIDNWSNVKIHAMSLCLFDIVGQMLNLWDGDGYYSRES